MSGLDKFMWCFMTFFVLYFGAHIVHAFVWGALSR